MGGSGDPFRGVGHAEEKTGASGALVGRLGKICCVIFEKAKIDPDLSNEDINDRQI
jgi:hypothetical protein